MQKITSPINPKDTGKEVDNLRAALLLFLDKQIIATFQPPDSPSEEEIIELRESLKMKKMLRFLVMPPGGWFYTFSSSLAQVSTDAHSK